MITNNIFSENIKEQQKLLFNCLKNLLSNNKKVALLDFPNHNNVGDNAIWLGEKAALKKLDVEVVYQCDIYGFSEKVLRNNLGSDGVVLLHGGGNLGSVWPEHQRFRERIIDLLKDFQIIQLPQSVFFDKSEELIQFIRTARSHQNLHILVRDKVSFNILDRNKLNIQLCPDMAFALGPVHQVKIPNIDAVWLARTDHESAGKQSTSTHYSIEKLDWLMGEPGRFYSKFSPRITVRIRRLVQKIFRRSAFVRNNFWKLNSSSFDIIAKRRFQRGVRILCRGKIVITDRLHGHIMSTLLGKPQILFDNHYKKIGNYRSCFEPLDEAIIYDPDGKLGLEEKITRVLAIADSINYDKN